MATGLQSLTDDQLLQLEQTIATGNPDFSFLSDEQVLAINEAVGGRNQGGLSFSEQDLGTPTATQPSPLSLGERVRLSFADDVGRKQFLERKFRVVSRLPNGKFAVGDNIQDLRPIDPEGLFNDILGDMADIVGEIPVIAGQVGGTVLGAPAGGVGAVAGAGAGAGVGQAGKAIIGRLAGVRGGTAQEEATDVALNAAFGATAQGVVGLSKALVARGLAPLFSKAADKAIATNPKVAGTLAKTFKITAAVDEDATLAAAKHGFNNTFTKKFLNPKSSETIAKDLSAAIESQRNLLGGQVRQAVSGLSKATNNGKVISLEDTFRQFTQDLQAIKVLNTGNIPNRFSTVKNSPRLLKLLGQMRESIKTKIPQPGKFGRTVGKGRPVQQFVAPKRNFTVKEIVELRRVAQDMFDDLSPEGQRVLFRFINSFDEITGQQIPGLQSKLVDVAQRTNNLKFLEANQNFSSFEQAVKQVKDFSGLNFKNTRSIEDFLKRFVDLNPSEKTAFAQLDRMVPTEFLSQAEKFSAAQKFKGANPNLLRVGAVLAFMGIGEDRTLEGKLGRLGIGLALTTPAGARLLLKSGESAIRRLATGASRVGAAGRKKAASRATAATVSRILEANRAKSRRQNGK